MRKPIKQLAFIEKSRIEFSNYKKTKILTHIIKKWKTTIQKNKLMKIQKEKYQELMQANKWRFNDDETQKLFMPRESQMKFGAVN